MNQRRLLVLDDDPTGSQCVADVQVAFDTDPAIPAGVLAEPGTTCFVLTNTRALEEKDAVELNRNIVGGVLEQLESPAGLHVVSRSDSTLRGHVIAEPHTIADTLAEHGINVDAFLFCPAMIEAGRFTEGDIHFAKVNGEVKKVEDTDFAADATFGYRHSNLTEFLEEKSEGAVRASECLSLSLADIREGGVSKVREILRAAHSRQWVVVNATRYSDMEVVAEAVGQLEAEGSVFVSRCGPSFVRPLVGQNEAHVLTDESITIAPGRCAHGFVVVGSHVGLTSQQLAVLQQRGGHKEFELQVPLLLKKDSRDAHIAEIAQQICDALSHTECVLYTSRDLIKTESKDESLAIARQVSEAVVSVVRAVRQARPAWVVAKGGITSHEVAASGLDIRRATVVGQFYPGQISLFRATDAPADVLDMPYVVFPGNVGGTEALADVVETLRNATSTATPH